MINNKLKQFGLAIVAYASIAPEASKMHPGGRSVNKLYFGDNIDVLRAMPAESVDLIYLDPPFNSKTDYGVIYGTKRGASQAQSHAFRDMWTWGLDAKRALDQTAERHLDAGALLDSFQRVFPQSNMLAYLAMMGVRLVEMQRILKSTGSLYLHCDPTASHYLKVLLDSIFGAANFRNEIVWKRTSAHSDASVGFGNVTDSILFYSRSEKVTWNQIRTELADDHVRAKYTYRENDGRLYATRDLRSPHPRPNLTYEYKGYKPHVNGWSISRELMERYDREGRLYFPAKKDGRIRLKIYLDQSKGVPLQNLWSDIAPINSQAQERLGYSTQKPLELLERIINASSNVGDVVLDPFCGCGTAIEASHALKRKWIGIDVTYLAIHVVEGRLIKKFGEEIKNEYDLLGRPKDEHDARALAARDWLEFQKWAVFSLGGLPKEKPGADGGIDGIVRYHRVGLEQPHRAVISVKGGQHIGVDAIHKLKSVVQRERAEVGILVCLDRPTSAMEKEALSEGEVGPPSRRVPRLQIVTVDQLFSRHAIDLPGTLDPPEIMRLSTTIEKPKKTRKRIEGQTEMLFAMENAQASYKVPKPRPNRSTRAVDIEVTRPHNVRRGNRAD